MERKSRNICKNIRNSIAVNLGKLLVVFFLNLGNANLVAFEFQIIVLNIFIQIRLIHILQLPLNIGRVKTTVIGKLDGMQARYVVVDLPANLKVMGYVTLDNKKSLAGARRSNNKLYHIRNLGFCRLENMRAWIKAAIIMTAAILAIIAVLNTLENARKEITDNFKNPTDKKKNELNKQ
jgi:hypothetical protein